MCGGYTYLYSATWVNHFAYIESAASKDTNFTVRFGHDGTKCCIYIGELNSVWAYPHVYVTEVEAGYSSYTVAYWQDGWAVGFEASAFGVVTRTQTDTQINNWSRSGQDVHFSSGTGNVGIGTTAPDSKLTVKDSFDNSTTGAELYTGGLEVINTSAVVGSYSQLKLGNRGEDPATDGRFLKSITNANNNHSFALGAFSAGTETEHLRVLQNGNVGIGTTTPNANALLDVSSTTKAFLPPRMTTTEKEAVASPTAGMVVYDSTLNKLAVYTGATWEAITSA